MTKWLIQYGDLAGATRVTALAALCSDYSYTDAVSIPDECTVTNTSTSAVLSDSNPPAWCATKLCLHQAPLSRQTICWLVFSPACLA